MPPRRAAGIREEGSPVAAGRPVLREGLKHLLGATGLKSDAPGSPKGSADCQLAMGGMSPAVRLASLICEPISCWPSATAEPILGAQTIRPSATPRTTDRWPALHGGC